MQVRTVDQPGSLGGRYGQSDWGWATVVVVDDDETCRELLLAIVRRFGVGRIIEAVDGIDCLDKMTGVVPDLIISDVSMPRMDGVELTQRIRSQPDFSDVPILIQTGSIGIEKHLSCFSAGASDVLTKPLRPSELRARMRVHLENRRLVYNLRKADQRITRELEGARRMQTALMPKTQRINEFKEKYGVSIQGAVHPSFSIGGDFWGIIDINDYAFGIYTVDFSGHGVMSALNTFRFHAVISEVSANHKDPASFLQILNEALVALLPRGQYATFFYAVIDTLRDTISWSGAGAPFPLLLRGQSSSYMDTTGTPLGLDANSVYTNSILPFPMGSGMFVYSDGMIEATTKDGGEVGEVEPLFQSLNKDVKDIRLDDVLGRFTEIAEMPLKDDLTAIWICHDGGEPRHHLLLDPSNHTMDLGRGDGRTGETQAGALLLETIDEQNVIQALETANVVIELGNGHLTIEPEAFRTATDGAILLSLTTRSAYRHSPCVPVCKALVERGWLLVAQYEDVLLAVQEAMANAVIHGNLGMVSPGGQERNIRQYWKELRARVEDPELSQRRVTLVAAMEDTTLVISVEDQGGGFDKADFHVASDNLSGRGESLMTSLASSVYWENGGRKVILAFALSEMFEG